MRLTGAQIMVQLLERQGITIIAGIPGGANLPLYDALGQSKRLRHILTRHEQGAGFLAQGMARLTGQPGVCLATSGPGATNVMTALADARLDSVPVVCITGQVARPLIGTDAFQEIDTYGMTVPITKHNFLVRSVGELLDTIPNAFRIAMSGRPGPVLVDVPKDVQTDTIDVTRWPEPAVADPASPLDAAAIAHAAQWINASRRPVFIIGGGAAADGAETFILRGMQQGFIPAASTMAALGIVPPDHDLSLGMIGMHGAPCANLALQECDLVIAVGTRFGDRTTGRVDQFCPHARIIHIDIDEAEFDKVKRADIAITGRARDVIETLMPFINRKPRTQWMQRIRELKERYPLTLNNIDAPGNPYALVQKVAAILGDEAVVVTDVGQHQVRTAQAWPFRRPRRWLTSGGLGTMGFGLPAAIGAALARPDLPVVCFTGDGSLLMNIQELATAAEVGANVKIVVMNNQALGLVHQQQELFYGNRIFASAFHRTVDYAAVARGFGIPAFDLDDGNPETILADALRLPGPCMINAPVDMHENVYPMVPPGAPNSQMMGVVCEREEDSGAEDEEDEPALFDLVLANLDRPLVTLPGGACVPAPPKTAHAVLELTVVNHPGVMSHVCGLFARRAFNVEGILCMPTGAGDQSRIWLLVNNDLRLGQMIKQAMKLEDVLDIRQHAADHDVFVKIEHFFRS